MERTDDDRYRVYVMETPVKSENDKKEYRVIRLLNGLTALLISDIHSKTYDYQDQNDERDEKKAACSLCVGVGCFNDPPEIPGMANFLKRMVFMGSEEYPQENNLGTFVKERGGFVDASTSYEHTKFYFDIHEKHLLPALDRFAQCFIKPLMKKDSVVRERKNVKRELQFVPCDKNKKQSFSFAETDPANKFTSGCFMTFGNNINDDKLYEELHKFRNRHYSAHRMTIAIQARLPLGILEKYVTTCFVDVPRNRLHLDYEDNVSINISGIEGMLTGTSSHLLNTKFKPGDELEVKWTIPLPTDFYKNKPHEYIAEIIAHEGKGSLTSYLRKKMPIFIGSCDNVQCESETFLRRNCVYTTLKLTVLLFNEKPEHLEEILDTIFSFVNLLKKEDPHKRTIYHDMYKMMEYDFRFINEQDSLNYVVSLCEAMHFYPSCDYITANKLIHIEYNPDAIQKCLDYLKPGTARITILHKNPCSDYNNKAHSCLNWYENKFTDIEVPKEWVKRWKSIEPLPDFHLPLKNVFIASDFFLIPIPAEVPKYPAKVYNNDVLEIWYCPDSKFRLPECYMNFQFVSSLGVQSPQNAVLMEIYCRILKLLLLEELYSATVAGFKYYISTSEKGIMIEINGFNEKLPLLLITIAKYMANYPAFVTKFLFETCKLELLNKEYYSNAFMDPYALVDDVKLSILQLVHYTHIDKHTALSDVKTDFKEFRSFVESFTKHLYIECLVQGNITQDDAIKTIQQCLEIINCGPLLHNTVQQMRVIQIPLGISYCKLKNMDEMDSTSVISNYYQVGVTSVELSILSNLVMGIMSEIMYDWLSHESRFKITSCDSDYINGIVGLSIIINTETNNCTTEDVDQLLETLLQLFSEILNNFLETDLEEYKKKIINAKTEFQYADKVLKEEVDRNWSEIMKGEYIFDRFEREMLAIMNIKINDMKEWFTKHTVNGSNFRKLSIHVVGNDSNKSAVKKENIENRKKEHFTLEYISHDQQETGDHHIVDVENYKTYLYTYPLKAKNKYD